MPQLLVNFPDGGEVVHDLTADVVTVGRLDDNTVPVDDPSVSSRHAQFTRQEPGAYLLRDLGSTNGTRVNDLRVTAEVALRPGDRLRFGKVEAVFGSAVTPPFSEVADGAPPVPDHAGTPVAGELAPVPAPAAPAAAVAERSHRPAGFTNAAPFQRPARTGDPIGRAMMVFALVAFLLLLVAMFYVFRLQPPAGLPT